MNDKANLNREIKILLIEILQAGEVTVQQAQTIDLFFKNSKLLNEVRIIFE